MLRIMLRMLFPTLYMYAGKIRVLRTAVVYFFVYQHENHGTKNGFLVLLLVTSIILVKKQLARKTVCNKIANFAY